MRFFIALLFCALFSGCGGNASVSGKVTFSDGETLKGGRVMFYTADSVASGAIQADGTYKMGSKSISDGVPRGTYQVAVHAHDPATEVPGLSPEESEKLPPKKPLIDGKYGSPTTSGITCDVKGSMKFDISVERAP